MFTFSITEMRAVLDRGRALPSIADVLKASELSSSITTSSRSSFPRWRIVPTAIAAPSMNAWSLSRRSSDFHSNFGHPANSQFHALGDKLRIYRPQCRNNVSDNRDLFRLSHRRPSQRVEKKREEEANPSRRSPPRRRSRSTAPSSPLSVVLAKPCSARPDGQGRSGAVAPVCPLCGPGSCLRKN